ncbi:hypothetical protein F7725_002960 [Dissostichus mawsoni]|uniref:TLC domain-containing protein n=1 Tax=Dissostichus mawsoni TaxID=36200 RepID=A0A7J5Y8U0_DISMA|nr:hypothetical protein F7725_002960 [Dissostichus mawsoni]
MLALMAAGCVFFPGVFLLSKHALKHMMGWSRGEADIVSARLVSSIQAIMASTAGFIITSSCRDVMEDSHWLTDNYILFATPYFAYDIYAMFLCYCHRLQMWRQGKGDFFQGVLFLAELSTPFVCLGKVLIQPPYFLPCGQYRQQHTVLHKVNGVLMLIAFFCCRVLLFPYLYASIPVYVVPLVAPWQCNLGAALLWPLQLYWFTLICRGALRLSAAGGCSKSTCKADNDCCLSSSNGCRKRT